MLLSYGETGKRFEVIEVKPLDVFQLKDFSVEVIQLEHVVPSFGFYIKEADTERLNYERLRLDGFPFGLQIKDIRLKKDVTVDGKTYVAEQYWEKKKGVRILSVLDTNLSKTGLALAKFKDIADYMLTEMTFDDTDKIKANKSGHSCTAYIKDIVQTLNIPKLIITHFTQKLFEAT